MRVSATRLDEGQARSGEIRRGEWTLREPLLAVPLMCSRQPICMNMQIASARPKVPSA
jgi:hypothetical protein